MIAFHGNPKLSYELKDKIIKLGHDTRWNLDSFSLTYILNDCLLVEPLGYDERCSCNVLTAEQFLEL